jgi:cytochrome c-type biogenesis protein
MTDVTLTWAVIAGVLSFLSPCVLPLVPPYLCFLAGTTIEEFADGGEKRARRDIMLVAMLFVLGFSTVFVLLGATASILGQLIRQYLEVLSIAAGAVIVLMGLHFLGVFRIALLHREARFQVERPIGLWGSYVMGLAFAFGWTPCIGPILGTILAMAGTEATAMRGAVLLAFYSAGLGIPFLAAALALEPFTGFMRRFRSRMHLVEKGMGVLLVATGVAFFTGSFTQMSFWLLETFPALGRLG